MRVRALGRSGFSLLEVVLACSLLVLVMTGSFFFFRMGSRGFTSAIAKNGAVGDLQRATRILQREVELTHLYSASVTSRTVDTSKGSFRRDGLAVVGLSSWREAGNFEVGSQLPKWDRWSIFYATEEELGRLYRVEIERKPPSGKFYPVAPLAGLTGYLKNDPLAVEDALRVTRLCDGVREFSAELDSSSQLIKMRLVLFSDQGLKMTSNKRVDGILETEYEIAPSNTFPEL